MGVQVTILSIDGDFAVVVVEDGEPSTVPLSALSPVHDMLQPQAVKRLSSLVDAYLSALPLYMQCAKVCWHRGRGCLFSVGVRS